MEGAERPHHLGLVVDIEERRDGDHRADGGFPHVGRCVAKAKTDLREDVGIDHFLVDVLDIAVKTLR